MNLKKTDYQAQLSSTSDDSKITHAVDTLTNPSSNNVSISQHLG